MTIQVHKDTVEVIHMRIRDNHPLTGGGDLTGETLQVALPIDGDAPSAWSNSTWESDPEYKDGEWYYLARFQLNSTGFDLAGETTYRMYAKVGSGPVIVKGDTLYAYSQ